MSNEELVSLTAVELRRRIGTKEISPVELLEACLDAHRGTQSGGQCHDCDVGEARAQRGEGGRRRRRVAASSSPLLHGLPTGIKDLDETEGPAHHLRLAALSRLRAGARCAMVASVREAGAIVVGKTNVPEFGAGANSRNPVWGATGNPVQPARSIPAARRAARRWRWPPTCCRSAPAPTPAARLRIPGRLLRRRGLPPLAGHGGRGTPATGLDADLGARARWAARWPIPACSSPRRSASTTAIRWLPLRASDRLRRAVAGRSRQPARGLDARISAACPVEKGIRRTLRAKMKAMKPPVPQPRRGEVRLRRGRPVLRRDPRGQLRGALPRRLHQEPRAARAQHARQLRDRRQA